MAEQPRSESGLTPFHQQEGPITGAEQLHLTLGAARVTIKTDPEATIPRYATRLVASAPLDGSAQQLHIAKNAISIEQQGGVWGLADSTQVRPNEHSFTPEHAQTRIGREVTLVLPPNSGEIHIALRRGSIHLTEYHGSAICTIATGDVVVNSCDGSITIAQQVGNTKIDNSRGNIQADVGTGEVTINDFTGTLQLGLAEHTSARINRLTLTGDSNIAMTGTGGSLVGISEQDSRTIIATDIIGSVMLNPEDELINPTDNETTILRTRVSGARRDSMLEKTSLQPIQQTIIRSDADEGLKQLVENKRLGAMANYLSKKSKGEPRTYVLQVSGKGRLVVGRLPKGENPNLDPWDNIRSWARNHLLHIPSM